MSHFLSKYTLFIITLISCINPMSAMRGPLLLPAIPVTENTPYPFKMINDLDKKRKLEDKHNNLLSVLNKSYKKNLSNTTKQFCLSLSQGNITGAQQIIKESSNEDLLEIIEVLNLLEITPKDLSLLVPSIAKKGIESLIFILNNCSKNTDLEYGDSPIVQSTLKTTHFKSLAHHILANLFEVAKKDNKTITLDKKLLEIFVELPEELKYHLLSKGFADVGSGAPYTQLIVTIKRALAPILKITLPGVKISCNFLNDPFSFIAPSLRNGNLNKTVFLGVCCFIIKASLPQVLREEFLGLNSNNDYEDSVIYEDIALTLLFEIVTRCTSIFNEELEKIAQNYQNVTTKICENRYTEGPYTGWLKEQPKGSKIAPQPPHQNLLLELGANRSSIIFEKRYTKGPLKGWLKINPNFQQKNNKINKTKNNKIYIKQLNKKFKQEEKPVLWDDLHINIIDSSVS